MFKFWLRRAEEIPKMLKHRLAPARMQFCTNTVVETAVSKKRLNHRLPGFRCKSWSFYYGVKISFNEGELTENL